MAKRRGFLLVQCILSLSAYSIMNKQPQRVDSQRVRPDVSTRSRSCTRAADLLWLLRLSKAQRPSLKGNAWNKLFWLLATPNECLVSGWEPWQMCQSLTWLAKGWTRPSLRIGRHAQRRIWRCMICGKSRVAHKQSQSHPDSQIWDQRGTRRLREPYTS